MRVTGAGEHLLGAVGRPPVAHGDADADREVARPGLDHVVRAPVRADEVVVHLRVRARGRAAARAGTRRRCSPSSDDVRLVDRAADRDEVADVGDRALAVAREAVDDLRRLPAADRRDPARVREVVERHDRLHALFVAFGEHPPVVVERGDRELAVLGLDPRPLDREAVGAEAVIAHERDVVGVAVVAVGAVARRLDARGVGPVLERPPVVVPVAAFDLMRGRGHAPDEPVRESHAHGAGA